MSSHVTTDFLNAVPTSSMGIPPVSPGTSTFSKRGTPPSRRNAVNQPGWANTNGVNLSLLNRTLFDLAGHHITGLGLIGFAAWFIAGLIAVRILQSDFVRRMLRR